MRQPLLALGLLLGCGCSHLSADLKQGDTAAPAQRKPISMPLQTFQLQNGMTVVLLEDHSLPKVVIDTWFSVGSKDEAPGRSGFAHLFEHLMFMGTARVPGNQFDVIMEGGGGNNNASTGNDRTNYYSTGPSALLPTLLWLDADRLEALGACMTQEKVDRQRDVVRNERRQNTENVPYGKVELLLPPALYPDGHPYHHSVIGSHEDLEAATLADVKNFFAEFYVPANATLVVAGDFEPAATKALVEKLFGALATKPLPQHAAAQPVQLCGEKRVLEGDKVKFPKLYLAWHSPAQFAPGDAELDLAASILADGPSSRLEKRLVLETRLAQSVAARQDSAELGSTFQVEALAAPGADLDRIKSEILAVLEEFCTNGPSIDELERAKTRQEAGFLRRLESLLARAEAVQAYRHFLGVSDGFQHDLDRYLQATREAVRASARSVIGPGRVDLRIVPQVEADPAALDQRPADSARRPFQAAAPQSFTLGNGIAVHVFPRPGTGLFAGSLIVQGGESGIPLERAGSALLAARWANSGAGGKDNSAFAEAAESLGATLGAGATRSDLSYDCNGLASRLEPTLDLFADLVLAPNLAETDFAREKEQLLNDVRKRDQDPNGVARNVGRALLFGAADPRGRPLEGTSASVGGLSSARVKQDLQGLLCAQRATFVFAGDLDVARLKAALERHFGAWKTSGEAALAESKPLVQPAPGRIVFVHRDKAPQTVIAILRPTAALEGTPRAARAAVDTIFGGTFTSRLNANLREAKGYTYGARSGINQEGTQFTFSAGAAVVTQHTGDSLSEFKLEFERMAKDGVSAEELQKAVESNRQRAVGSFETTGALARSLAVLVRSGRPLDSIGKDLAALDAVDLAGANALARSGLFEWQDCLVVLVGDREEIQKQLAAAGFGGAVEVDPTGAPKR
jgi:predicted Zn-dependent peptidase